ncbi:hypothetical protein [Luteibaculum oceani]|uniref:Uncharacterized protein n=1 Tax=Luteibaculum oceani TaxID=1294296 RepID=A0A5C6V8F8_9FLAO|nr:hypothetical protein [Luteibaculum oceani]TXC81652.1 hypothetical protein FRX97_03810 [Luteibaculum oceani]
MSSDSNRTNRIKLLEQWTKENPDDPFAFYALALELKAIGEIVQAQDRLNEICAEFPDYLPAFQMLGHIFLEQEKIEAAKKFFQQAKDLAYKQSNHKAIREISDFLMQIQLHYYE